MSEYLPAILPAAYALPLLLVVLLLLLTLFWYRYRRGRRRTLKNVLATIAFERIDNLVIPKADEGEIQIDHLLLTPNGLLVIDVKNVEGAVFGSDKMQDWTVISEERRFTFGNPQPALYDRIAAVRQIVRQVPVAGRILFLDGARFTKGTPDMVASLDELLQDFSEPDKATAKMKVEAFKPHWELIRERVVDGRGNARLVRYRHL